MESMTWVELASGRSRPSEGGSTAGAGVPWLPVASLHRPGSHLHKMKIRCEVLQLDKDD